MIHNDHFAPNPISGSLSNSDTAPSPMDGILPNPDNAPAQDVLAGATSPSRLRGTLTKLTKRVRKLSGTAPLLTVVAHLAQGNAQSTSVVSIHPLPSSSDNSEAVAPATAPANPNLRHPSSSEGYHQLRPPLTTRHRIPSNVRRPSLGKNYDDASKAPRVSMTPLFPPVLDSADKPFPLKRSPGMLELSPPPWASCEGGNPSDIQEYPTIGQLIQDLTRERDTAQRIAREAEAKLSEKDLLLADAVERARLLADQVEEKDSALARAKGESEATATNVSVLMERLIGRDIEIKSLGCEMIDLLKESIEQEKEIGDLRGKLARAEETIAAQCRALDPRPNPSSGAGSGEPCTCSASVQLKDKEEELADILGALRETKVALSQRNDQLEERTAQLSATEEELEKTIAALAETKASVEIPNEELTAAADTLEATKAELDNITAELDDMKDKLSLKTLMCSSYEYQITFLTTQREDLREENGYLRRQMANGFEVNPRWSGHSSTAAIGDCGYLDLTLQDNAAFEDDWREFVSCDETQMYDTQMYDTTIDCKASRASRRAFRPVW